MPFSGKGFLQGIAAAGPGLIKERFDRKLEERGLSQKDRELDQRAKELIFLEVWRRAQARREMAEARLHEIDAETAEWLNQGGMAGLEKGYGQQVEHVRSLSEDDTRSLPAGTDQAIVDLVAQRKREAGESPIDPTTTSVEPPPTQAVQAPRLEPPIFPSQGVSRRRLGPLPQMIGRQPRAASLIPPQTFGRGGQTRTGPLLRALQTARPGAAPPGFARPGAFTGQAMPPSSRFPGISDAGVLNVGRDTPVFRAGTTETAPTPTPPLAAQQERQPSPLPYDIRLREYYSRRFGSPNPIIGAPYGTPLEQALLAGAQETYRQRARTAEIPTEQAVKEAVGADPTVRRDRMRPTGGTESVYQTQGQFGRDLHQKGQPLVEQAPLAAAQQVKLAEAQRNLAALKRTIEPLETMIDRFRRGENPLSGFGMVGPFWGRVSTFLQKAPRGWGIEHDPVFAALSANLADVRNQTYSTISGAAVSEGEAARLNEQTPTVNDPLPLLLAKTLATVQNHADAWAAYSMGVPLEQYYDMGYAHRLTQEDLEVLQTEFSQRPEGETSFTQIK